MVGYRLDDEDESLDIEVFIEAPYHKKVFENTRFWNVSGLDVSLDVDGIRVDTESFVSMLIGGVAFDTPDGTEADRKMAKDRTFRLFKNKTAAFERTYDNRNRCVIYFDGSVRGMGPGTPVEFKGIKIGEVVEVKLEYHIPSNEIKIPVIIDTEPEAVHFGGQGGPRP